MAYENEELDDVQGQEDESSGAPERESGKPSPREKSVPKPDNTIESHRKDVEEAVAQQRAKKGDEFPWRSGYGRTGKREAELHRYEELARNSGTTLPKAVRDYHSIESLARQNPVAGMEAMAQRLGLDGKQVAVGWAAEHGLFPETYQPQGDLGYAAYSYNRDKTIESVIEEESSHPANVHLRDEGAMQWMLGFMGQELPNGQTVSQELLKTYPGQSKQAIRKRLQFVYEAYDKTLRTFKESQKAQARQADMAATRDIQRRYPWV